MIRLPKESGLNVVPFIDVMLVLLAIVLSISTFIAHGQIKIELPKAQNSAAISNDNKEKLVISISAENIFYANDKEIDFNSLQERINELSKDTLVELKTDKNSKFDSFMQVINLLKNKEHQNFQIITEKSR